MATRRSKRVGVKRRKVSRAATLHRREADAGNGVRADQGGDSRSSTDVDLSEDSAIIYAPESERLSGVALLQQAMAVAAAADAYSARGQPNISALTLQFLLGRSLELALKAYLSHKDCAEDKPKEIGQDLSKLLEQAAAHSFEFRGGTDDADRRAVAALSPNYMRKLVGYAHGPAYYMVTSRMLRDIVHRAITAVFMDIWNEDPVRFNLRRASDRALGLCIADDACYEELPAAVSHDLGVAATG
ncbi:MAG TPA: hypothetical protein VK130_07770 [Steroidobacteraceae bacterium]|nr:hypothetical protein [Steroidobacteraceae bacterium]